jgi:hypothetical protein
MTTFRFIFIALVLKLIITNRQLTGYLLGVPLLIEKRSHFKHYLFINFSGIMAALRKLMRQILRLVLSITSVATHLLTNRRFKASQNPGNFRLCLSCFHERISLVTFGLAEMCIGHWLLRLTGQKALILMHLRHSTR